VKFAFIEASEVAFPVRAICRVLGVSSSGYYAWRRRPPSARVKEDAQMAVEIAAEHKRSRGIYGSPRVHRGLRARGVRVSRKRVERLMRQNGIKGRQNGAFGARRTRSTRNRSRRTFWTATSTRADPKKRGPAM
jgi:hypothetical protein